MLNPRALLSRGSSAAFPMAATIDLHWAATLYTWKRSGLYHSIISGSGQVHRLHAYTVDLPAHTWRRNSNAVARSWNWTADEITIQRLMTHAPPPADRRPRCGAPLSQRGRVGLGGLVAVRDGAAAWQCSGDPAGHPARRARLVPGAGIRRGVSDHRRLSTIRAGRTARGTMASYTWVRNASTVLTSPSASGIRARQPTASATA
jgi:hypothetical protein